MDKIWDRIYLNAPFPQTRLFLLDGFTNEASWGGLCIAGVNRLSTALLHRTEWKLNSSFVKVTFILFLEMLLHLIWKSLTVVSVSKIWIKKKSISVGYRDLSMILYLFFFLKIPVTKLNYLQFLWHRMKETC